MNTLSDVKLLEHFENSMNNSLDSIPDELLNLFTKNAVKHAKKMIKNKDIDLQSLSYMLYRSYVIGMMYANLNNKNSIKKYSKRKIKKSKLKIVK